jgi:hypothetical protein
MLAGLVRLVGIQERAPGTAVAVVIQLLFI